MRKETDLPKVKMIAHVLLDMPIAETSFSPATLAAWGATDSLDTTATLSLGVEDGNYIQADGKTATITVQLYGGPEADFNITLFINHQPVQLNGADYLSVRTVKNQMVEATFQIDTSALGTLNTVYPQSGARDSEGILPPAECGLRRGAHGKAGLLSLSSFYKRTGRKRRYPHAKTAVPRICR